MSHVLRKYLAKLISLSMCLNGIEWVGICSYRSVMNASGQSGVL